MLSSLLALGAAVISGIVAFGAIFLKSRSVAAWSFFAGMGLLSMESALDWMSIGMPDAANVRHWQTLVFITKSFLPGTWLLFSLTYSRGNYREFLAKWRFALAAAFIIPVGLAIGFRTELIEVLPLSDPDKAWWLKLNPAAKVLNGLLLVASVLVLMNLEGTMRSAVGTMRWRIKFVVLGLAVMFGARIYSRSEALLFSGQSLALADIETCAVLIGCILICAAYFRSGFAEIDVYPSQAILSHSITVLLAGAYLFIVGVLAQIVAQLGGAGNFQVQAVLVLLAITILAVLLFSDRLRQGIRQFVSRHFARPRHDSRHVWTLATRQMASMLNPTDLCRAAAKLISETFEILSASVWLVDDRKQQLTLAASTSKLERDGDGAGPTCAASDSIREELARHSAPFDLEKATGDRSNPLKQLRATHFSKGGNRVCIPLFAGERWLGVAILADRVNGAYYTVEELDLLKCIGDQLSAALLNLRLTEDVMQAKELEAFQTMSTFFVHDLKNAVSGLNLMLRNLPVHFDDPEFRADALRGIGNTVTRIDTMIERLSALRNKVELKFEESDLNQLVSETIERLDSLPGLELAKELRPLPKIFVDREQIRNVVTNLLINARDALAEKGRIHVETTQLGGRAVLSVADNGSGMSAQFMQESLFRPFQSTKKKGLGIGMFQSKTIVEAHGGAIQVESEAGKGTTFRVALPIKPQA
jgi:putative PEP-CTERM system histidine kinase